MNIFSKISLFLLLTVFTYANYTIDNGKGYFYTFDKLPYPKITVDGKPIPILKHPSKKDKLLAIIPVYYKTKDTTKKIKLYDGKKLIKEFSLNVTKGDYKKEILKVSKKYIKPPLDLSKKIKSEFKEANEIYNTISKQNYINGKFILPMDSKITSHYGNARMFNDTVKSYHSGTDFRAKVGTPLKAINDGVVVLAKSRYYAGGSIIIDHGKGIYSCYFHLDKYKVKKGQKVQKGDIIALSGKSGRITGPHLHLTIKVNGTTVAPIDFINKYNKLY